MNKCKCGRPFLTIIQVNKAKCSFCLEIPTTAVITELPPISFPDDAKSVTVHSDERSTMTPQNRKWEIRNAERVKVANKIKQQRYRAKKKAAFH